MFQRSAFHVAYALYEWGETSLACSHGNSRVFSQGADKPVRAGIFIADKDDAHVRPDYSSLVINLAAPAFEASTGCGCVNTRGKPERTPTCLLRTALQILTSVGDRTAPSERQLSFQVA